MKTYYIYHVPGIKIGVTVRIKTRMREQGFESWEILEEHTDGWLAGDREIELQKEYGYPVDTKHYMLNASMVLSRDANSYANASKEGFKTESFKKHARNMFDLHGHKFTNAGARSGKSCRITTIEIANEIRNKYKPRIYTVPMLSKEYNINQSTIKAIIQGRTYN